MTVAWEPEDIFERDLRRLCEDGIQKYREKYQNCGFKFEGGLRCIARYPGHEEHCDEKGVRVSGNFDPSEYQEDSTKTINEIRELFITIYKNLCARDQETPSLPDPAVLLRQREDVFEEFASIWKVDKKQQDLFHMPAVSPRSCTFMWSWILSKLRERVWSKVELLRIWAGYGPLYPLPD